MTTLAKGASTTVTVADQGEVAVSTNGGFFSVTVTPTIGSAMTYNLGPAATRQVFGPYAISASIVVANDSCDALTYLSVGASVQQGGGGGGVSAISQLTGGLTDNLAGARMLSMGGLAVSPIVHHMLADLGAVASVTVPAPGTPANEVITTTGSYGLGSAGSNDWGGHQPKLARMGDGTLFKIWFDGSYNLDLSRSATGGTFGSAWTVVDTIAMTAREAKDKDAHLLRNPVTDQVHLISSDNSGAVSAYRIRTYANSATKTLVNDVMVPNRWTGGSAAASVGWFSQTQTPNYSAASIGDDGVIVLVSSLSTGLLDGSATSEMDAIKRWQLMRWNGGTWTFSPIYSQRLSQLANSGTLLGSGRDSGGPRLNYDRIWVSPPGHEGYIVGICGMDVKFKDWSATRNPNYSAAWANTIADATYFGSGRYAEMWMWKVPLSNPASMSIYALAMPQYRTTDLPGSPPSAAYGGFIIQDVFLDSSGRIWIAVNEGDTNTTQLRSLIVCDKTGAQLAKFVSAGGITSGTTGGFFEDLSGAVWMQHVDSGGAMSARLLTTTVTGGVPTAIQTDTAAVQQNTTQWCKNLTTGMYQCIPSAAAFQFQPTRRNGSVLSNNWLDMVVGCGPDHTGTAPGTVQTLPTNGTYQFKRVRLQIPAA